MNTVLPVVMFGLAGLLAGGTYSLHRQKAARGSVVLCGLLALLAFAGGVMWLV